MRYFIANWKSNKTLDETLEWFDQIQLNSNDQRQVIVCPPFPYLQQSYFEIKKRKLSIQLGSQNISPFPYGAYTGEVTAPMIKPWCDWVLVGHSERRKYFHESNQEIANKVRIAVEAKFRVILCIDEPYAQSQLAAIESELLNSCIVAYEPVSAIGSGQPDNPEHASQIAGQIKAETGFDIPVVYGGSVKSENVKEFLEAEGIDGVLVGGASLDATQWEFIVNRLVEN